MNREDIFSSCQAALSKSNTLLMELPTGFGKTKCSIDLVNWLSNAAYKDKKTKMLLLVAKTVHKQTWKDEFKKWGGIDVSEVTIECYESLKKHKDEYFNFVLLDEVHHVKSDARIDLLSTIKFDYMLGLSATIPRNLKQYFRYRYHSQIVSCAITEAIENEVLPEPEILLFPLKLNNTVPSETIEINPKAKGKIVYGSYIDLWKCKRQKVHAFLSCTPKQKLMELDSYIQWCKNKAMMSRSIAAKNIWLHKAGERLEFLAYQKNDIVKDILKKLSNYRTITFCKTIQQAELLGKYCIHSKNNKATEIYDRFNQKEINHITAVNILNENANLVDCKYAIFANFSSSDTVYLQRLGRSLRHKSPVIIMPYFEGTREQEIIEKMTEDFNKDFIHIIKSIDEI